MDAVSIARQMRSAVTDHEAQLEVRTRPQKSVISDAQIGQLLTDFVRSISSATQNTPDPEGERKARAEKEFQGAQHIVRAWIGANQDLVRQVHNSMMSFPGMREALKTARPVDSAIEEAIPHTKLKELRDKKAEGASLAELAKLLPPEQQQKFGSMIEESK